DRPILIWYLLVATTNRFHSIQEAWNDLVVGMDQMPRSLFLVAVIVVFPKHLGQLIQIIRNDLVERYFYPIISKTMDQMSNKSGNILLALLTGAIVGAGIGILFAPDKGRETRGKIKKRAMDAAQNISETTSHMAEEFSDSVQEKKKKFEEKLEEVLSKMSYKAEDVINSLEEKLEALKKKNEQLQK